jgi:thiamine monophosphate synthase
MVAQVAIGGITVANRKPLIDAGATFSRWRPAFGITERPAAP